VVVPWVTRDDAPGAREKGLWSYASWDLVPYEGSDTSIKTETLRKERRSVTNAEARVPPQGLHTPPRATRYPI